MRLNVLFGGEAGQGPNILTHTLGKALVKKGYCVFYARDYQSLIRGGHNFNVLTFSDEPCYSNDSFLDLIVALDENTIDIHKKNLNKKGVVIKGKGSNMFFAGKVFKAFGLKFESLDEELKSLKKMYEQNVKDAKAGYDSGEQSFELNKLEKREKRDFFNGSEGVSRGAIASGLDLYYAYPMTPATSVMSELASKQVDEKFSVIELENEIAVANAGVGSAITGAKTMVGTSGGGFDLMSEALSLTGIANVPLVFYLSQRPGPGTGVATYQAQGDLNIARYSGHGEFPRVILAPGDPLESEELTSHAFYFSQKYQIPSIIISDKHLGESFYSIRSKARIIPSGKLTNFGRYNSYEKNKYGSATENPSIVNANVQARLKKQENIKSDAMKFKQYKIYGNPRSKNVLISWGSTKGVILDCMEFSGIDAKFIQILYIEPFSNKEIWKELIGKNLILIENNSTGQLGQLIKEKTGFSVLDKNKILRYDGRPFLRDELEKEIRERLK